MKNETVIVWTDVFKTDFVMVTLVWDAHVGQNNHKDKFQSQLSVSFCKWLPAWLDVNRPQTLNFNHTAHREGSEIRSPSELPS